MIHYGYEDCCTTTINPAKPVYKTVFEINFSKTELNNGRIQNNEHSLFQSDPNLFPIRGLDYIQNKKKSYMIFKCPEMTNINISVFIVLRAIGSTNNSGEWAYIIGNDNGGYDKFIGYKTGTTNKLIYGGGFPVLEYTCTIPSNVNIFEKHLISCHWLLNGSCIYINGVKSTDSDFSANPRSIGETCGTIFVNDRFIGTTGPMSKPFHGAIYGIKIISGFLEPTKITDINNKMITEYKI